MGGELPKLPERCVPCEGKVEPLERDAALDRMPHAPGWDLDYPFLRLSRRCRDFAQALAFVNAVGALAEEEGHHPDIHLTGYRDVELVLFTHAIGGLSDNDFVMARKISALP